VNVSDNLNTSGGYIMGERTVDRYKELVQTCECI
jgi:hypothetical protein